MAKYETTVRGPLSHVIAYLIENSHHLGSSVSIEDSSSYSTSQANVAVYVFERYSMFGENRVSLNVTMVEDGQDVFISAITAGGSKAVLFKMDTIGEGTFLKAFIKLIEHY